ncbi:MAG: hypothetical protein JWR21_1669 [Herminiimonas sp.]|nr:hypothetical protein [Herminiimonas sp.]MDB5854597.1 hypothetical protein [Herminiimonas sp.]
MPAAFRRNMLRPRAARKALAVTAIAPTTALASRATLALRSAGLGFLLDLLLRTRNLAAAGAGGTWAGNAFAFGLIIGVHGGTPFG